MGQLGALVRQVMRKGVVLGKKGLSFDWNVCCLKIDFTYHILEAIDQMAPPVALQDGNGHAHEDGNTAHSELVPHGYVEHSSGYDQGLVVDQEEDLLEHRLK